MPSKLSINGDSSLLNDELLKQYIGRTEKRSLFKQFLRYCAVGLHLLLPFIGWIRLWAKTVTVYEGELGLSQNTNTGEYIILPPGRHVLLSPFHNFTQCVKINDKVVNLGPFTIVTVNTNEVAVTYKDGVLTILKEGRHMLDSATHIYKNHVSTKQQINKIQNIQVNTADNVPLHVDADVFYQITRPETALNELQDIEQAVIERAENALAQVFLHHILMDISPISFNMDAKIDSQPVLHLDSESTKKSKDAPRGIGNIVNEFLNALSVNLDKLGIKLLNVGITAFSIRDKGLEQQLGQQAVTWVKTTAALQTAENNKKVTITNAQAQAESSKIIAEGDANASRIRAEGFFNAGKILENSKVAQNIQYWSSQKDIVGASKTMILSTSNSNLIPQIVMPESSTPTMNNSQ